MDKISTNYFVDKSVLLIGTGDTYGSYIGFPNIFMKNGAKSCEYLEIHEPYIRRCKACENYVYEITHGDVKNIKQIFTENEFDVIVWSHGPEHVSFEDFELILSDLYYVARNFVLLIVPYGNHWDGQGSKSANPSETHLQKNIQKDTFNMFGFNIETLNEINRPDAHIFLWKELLTV
jgi:hypothetical protein